MAGFSKTIKKGVGLIVGVESTEASIHAGFGIVQFNRAAIYMS